MGHDRLFIGGKSKPRAQQAANRLGTAAAVNYNDFSVAPPLNANSVQGAIDALKAGAGAGGTVLWKPAGPAGPGVFTDWVGVMSIVSASAAPVLVLVDRVDGDPPLVIPPGDYEMNHAILESVYFGDPSVADIDMQDGAVLRNFALSGSLTLNGHPTAGLPVEPNQAVYIQYGACLRQRVSDRAVFVFVGQAWVQQHS